MRSRAYKVLVHHARHDDLLNLHVRDVPARVGAPPLGRRRHERRARVEAVFPVAVAVRYAVRPAVAGHADHDLVGRHTGFCDQTSFF